MVPFGGQRMRYGESVEFLYALGNEIKTVKFGLESIREVLERLGNPQKSFRAVHVAGTNGKGSTCAMIEAALRHAGVRTGLYTSPHLVEPTERINIAGVPVTREQFVDAFARVHDANEGREHHTTYFETVTAMAFLLFRDAAVDVAVVETGLGGRLDATNVLQQPAVTVITPVDFDHEQYLGNSLDLIAAEKAGILKAGSPAVFARQRPEASAVLEARAKQLEVPVVWTNEYRIDDLRTGPLGSDFGAVREKPVSVHCPLPGAHQVDNALAAVAALELLDVSPDGIAETRWPGRLERIADSPEIVLDGAHNPAGARALAEYIRSFHLGRRRISMVYGAMRDKAVGEVTEILFPLADEVVVTAPDSPRAVRPEALLESSDHPRIHSVGTVVDALNWARSTDPAGIVFMTGSLYLVGEVRRLLQ